MEHPQYDGLLKQKKIKHLFKIDAYFMALIYKESKQKLLEIQTQTVQDLS